MKINDDGGTPLLDRTLIALADPTRRAIVKRLMRGEACVTELAEPFDMSLNAVSKHIRVLERAGLIQRRRVWREHWVSFDSRPMDQVAAWIAQQQEFWKTRLSALNDLLEAEDSAKKSK